MEFDYPLQPFYAQYIKLIYDPFSSIVPYHPYFISLKDKMFLFTKYNTDYHKIVHTENIIFKELLNNYITIDQDIALYNYD